MKNKYLVKAGILALLMLLLCGAALAAASPTVTVHASVTLEGAAPSPEETYVLRMAAASAENPMPQGAQGAVFDVKAKGPGKVSFPAISFERVGVYDYTLRQLQGNNDDCRYDASVYRMTVYVVNAEDGGLSASVTLYRENEAQKRSSVSFCNVYPSDPGTVTPTGVQDRWMGNLAMCAGMLAVCAVILRKLRSGNQNCA